MSFKVIEGCSSFTPPCTLSSTSNPCFTYYKIVTSGDPTHSLDENTGLPLIIVHGGPFLGHDYCLPLQSLVQYAEIKGVIFYDQVGCGKSTHFKAQDDDYPTNFWKVNIVQLKALVEHLQSTTDILRDGFILFGHSLGSILVTSYAAANPQGIKGIILASAMTTFADLKAANLYLFKDFPETVAETIVAFEEHCLGVRQANGLALSAEAYLEASEVIRRKHFNRAQPRSDAFNRSMANCMEVMDVFGLVAGGTIQFLWSGPLTEHDCVLELPKIEAPTLIIKGEFDQALSMCQEPFMRYIQDVEETTIEGASHIMTDEAPEKLVDVIGMFIKRLCISKIRN